MVDKRLLIHPYIRDEKYGPEKSLYEILVDYYISSGLVPELAKTLAVMYSNEWAKEI